MNRILLFLLVIILGACSTQPDRVLVFSKTAGFRHQSIEVGKKTLEEIAREMQFEVEFSEDASDITERNLQRFSAVVFLSTTGDILDVYQQADFERFIQAGGGFLGIHAAADTEYKWEWYGRLVGGYFKSHPHIQEARLEILDATHPSTAGLPEEWMKTDEWYNYYNIQEDLNVLINLDESSYEGGENGSTHPIAWYHDFDGGRAFYTGLGHTDESFSDPLFLSHIKGALTYVLDGSGVNYARATSMRVPEENRFTKVVLEDSLNEPTEMAIMLDETILFVERKGAVKKYDPTTGVVETINQIDVYYDQEDGLMGITLDPDFENNHFVYMYYSPAGDDPKQNLSRFEYKDGKIDLSSEVVMLEVKTQRDECCHTGGSLTWDRSGNLYLSTGDDTNPFESDGFGPIDERPGREPFDGQRGPANTNDLRGKILRIHPEPDGSYSIPEGNLFPEGTEGARPEIYVMGNRNPYRISVDQRTGYLYWGEVGPDANNDSTGRGPRGHDEVNQAREAGNFGWPMFVADNKAYNRYDFANQQSGEPYNAAAPRNTSPNNTGLVDLPPAQPAFIWYPYGESEEFPQVGAGGRNAMAGPVYYSEDYSRTENALPAYYDGKLFIYDWIRGWIFAVTMTEEGDFVSMEPFMANTEFSNPIEMEMSPNGVMYMLEYGKGWFTQNPDARLVRIDYNGGNRKPVIATTIEPEKGASPLRIEASAAETNDPDGDNLTYQWNMGDGSTYSDAEIIHNYNSPGIYEITLTVSDGATEVSETREVWAGNEPAEVSVNIEGNTSFYWKGAPVLYSVSVTDEEDGSSAAGSISEEDIMVGIEEVKGLSENVELGHKLPLSFVEGKQLIDGSDCLACHKVEGQSIGPDYRSVAKKYKDQGDAIVYLSDKIINGGSGVWGETAMSAHPQITKEEASKIASYILALGEEQQAGFPTSGSYMVSDKIDQDASVVIRASYADKGNGDIPSVVTESFHILKSSTLNGSSISDGEKHQVMTFSGMNITLCENDTWIEFNGIDLSGISAIQLTGSLIQEENETKVEVLINDTPIASGSFTKLGPEGPQPGTYPALAEIPVNSSEAGTIRFKFTSTVQAGPAVAIVSFDFKK